MAASGGMVARVTAGGRGGGEGIEEDEL